MSRDQSPATRSRRPPETFACGHDRDLILDGHVDGPGPQRPHPRHDPELIVSMDVPVLTTLHARSSSSRRSKSMITDEVTLDQAPEAFRCEGGRKAVRENHINFGRNQFRCEFW